MAGDNESKTAVALVDPLVGSIFDKRFRIEARIAQGGFGAIYRATHVKSGHPIALKVLLPTLAQDLGIVARFRREGDTLTALRNPHTITAYELGQAADRTLFIVMELLHGESLFDRYEHNGPFEWRRMVKIARQVCESLAEAHALGIVHRDLKPTNIHLEHIDSDPDFVKVLDFGIAKILRGSESFDASDITNAGTMIGTLDYMSPEQMVGGQVTGQTDIYTVGIVMYEMIAGIRPFPEAKTAAAALGAMLKTTPQPLYLRAPIPEHVSKVVMRCLEREVARRYRSVGDLVADLDAVLVDAGSASLDTTNTFDLDSPTRAPKSDAKAADDEATTFTPPPERLLESMRTPKVERVGLWDDSGTDDATTIGNARHDERVARDVRADRAVSRAETNVRDGVDPHGPTIASRPIEGSGEHAPLARPGSEGAKTPIVQRDSDAKTPTVRRDDGPKARLDSEGAKTPMARRDSEGAKTPTARRDSDGLKTPVRLDSEAGAKTPTVRREGDGDRATGGRRDDDASSQGTSTRRDGDGGRGGRRDDDASPQGTSARRDDDRAKPTSARSDFDSRASSGRPVPSGPEGRPRSPTAQPANLDSRGRSTAPPNLDGRARPQTVPPSLEGRARPQTVPPNEGRARPQTVPPSPIPATPPPRPLQSRNLATPVPSVVVAPFSSTPRRPTPPPTGIPTPPPGSLPPGVPLPPTRPTPQPGSYPPGVPIPPKPGGPGYTPPGTPGQMPPGMQGQLSMPVGAPGMPRPNIATPPPLGGQPQRGVPTPPPGAPYQPPYGGPTPSHGGYQPPHGVPTPPPGAAYQPPHGVPTPPPGAAYQPPHGVPTPPPGAPYQPNAFSPGAMPGSNPAANPFAMGQAPGSNPSANPFAVPGSNPSANPFAVPGSNPSANPFTAGQAPGSNPSGNPYTPGSNPFATPLPPTGPVSLPRPQYDMSRMAAREEMIRRLVWIAVIVVGVVIGVVVAMR